MRKVLFIIAVLLSFSGVSAEGLFPYYDYDVFFPFAESVVEEPAPEEGSVQETTVTKDTSFQVSAPAVVTLPEVTDHPVIVTITDTGFEPAEVQLEPGQQVTWVNARKLKAMVVGVREISGVRSTFLGAGDSFTYTFSETGSYTYVDAVVIGSTGQIVVL